MQTITVRASREYDVIIGKNILSQAGKFTAERISGRKVAIISDTNVWPIYGNFVAESFEAADFRVDHYQIQAGEESKNLSTYGQILDFLVQKQIGREDVIVAVGGGVVGDLTGFAAATYLRGIAYIQLPTSLLAMVDSSVGGKTALNLPGGKNLVGAFYQPSMVLCDTNTLDTLPEENFREGCAEVIKYAILYDEALFDHLMQYKLEFDRDAVIGRCIELKSNVVAQDEFDRGRRKLLNLGHTFGHAIEYLHNFHISHGNAVAIGIALAAKAAQHMGMCTNYTTAKILQILQDFDLPVMADYSAFELCSAAVSDKKRNGNKVDLILPAAIGNCQITPMSFENLQSIMEVVL